jgi:hypothetical protein
MGRKLGKFAAQIERCMVRFGDENGPKGGLDKTCLIQIFLSSLPSVVVEARGATEREAFDKAVATAERATRNTLERRGFSAKMPPHQHSEAEEHEPEEHETEEHEPDAPGQGRELEPTRAPGGIIGRREGQAQQNLLEAAARPEKVARDAHVDTSKPNVSETDRKVGHGHTARRNTKLNTAGMSVALEDSTRPRPSRKSTRKSANRTKSGGALSRRTKAEAHTPKARASRATHRT